MRCRNIASPARIGPEAANLSSSCKLPATSAVYLWLSAILNRMESIMKFLIDRFFSDIDRLFDEEWLAIWLLDDF